MNHNCTNAALSASRILTETNIVLNATLQLVRRDVSSLQLETTHAMQRLDCGDVHRLDRVLLAAEKARTSYNSLMGMHSRAMGTYREVIRNA